MYLRKQMSFRKKQNNDSFLITRNYKWRQIKVTRGSWCVTVKIKLNDLWSAYAEIGSRRLNEAIPARLLAPGSGYVSKFEDRIISIWRTCEIPGRWYSSDDSLQSSREHSEHRVTFSFR